MNEHLIRSLYGLKYNPFVPNLPAEAIWVSPPIKNGPFLSFHMDPGQVSDTEVM